MKLTPAMLRELRAINETGEPSDPIDWHRAQALWFHAREKVLTALIARGLISDTPAGFMLTDDGRTALVAAAITTKEKSMHDKPHNGRAAYTSTKTWGTRQNLGEKEGPAYITPKRIAVRLHTFDRVTGKCVDRKFPLANYRHELVWYEINGQPRVTIGATENV